MELEESGIFVEGTISRGGSTLEDVGRCGSAYASGDGGFWYSVIGSGDPLIASICHNATEFDTQISVFSGSCGNLSCIGGHNDVDYWERGYVAINCECGLLRVCSRIPSFVWTFPSVDRTYHSSEPHTNAPVSVANRIKPSLGYS